MPNPMKLAEALEVVRRQGRNGDTELAHVNPREAAILRAMGGSGTVNPKTGMREYYDILGAGDGWGTGSSDNMTAGGDSDASFGQQAQQAIGNFINTALTNPAPIYTTPGMMTATAGFLGRNVTPALESFLGPAQYGAGSAPQLAGMAGYFPGVGDATAQEDRAMQMAFAAAPSFARPAVGAMPSELTPFLSSGMSPLQQRSAIGTFGTQGVNPAFRTDDARRYYASLLAQELVSPSGAINEQAYMLPVEQQYLGNVFGRQASTPSQAFEAIRGSL